MPDMMDAAPQFLPMIMHRAKSGKQKVNAGNAMMLGEGSFSIFHAEFGVHAVVLRSWVMRV